MQHQCAGAAAISNIKRDKTLQNTIKHAATTNQMNACTHSACRSRTLDFDHKSAVRQACAGGSTISHTLNKQNAHMTNKSTRTPHHKSQCARSVRPSSGRSILCRNHLCDIRALVAVLSRTCRPRNMLTSPTNPRAVRLPNPF